MFSVFGSRLDQNKEIDNPEIICQIPHHAVINSIPPIAKSGGNILGLKSNTKPNPEFCIPVSMVIVLRSLLDNRNAEATP